MSFSSLPAEIHGDWIWKNAASPEVDSYTFFRQEFVLEETPTSAEIWVAANSEYHVYVNGRHFTRGYHPSNKYKMAASYSDAAHCLQYGRNVIAVLVHNQGISRFSTSKKVGALWCQMNVDGQPALATDETWMTRDGNCFLDNRPRISSSDGFVETVDLRLYPHGWTDVDFRMDEHWSASRIVGPVNGGQWMLHPLPELEKNSEHYSYLNMIIYGKGKADRACSHVYYPRAKKTPGVYLATSFMHSPDAAEGISFQVFSDDPFYLYINDELVLSQGHCRDIENWTNPEWSQPRCYAQDEHGVINGKANINKGANHICLIQLVDVNSSGAMLIFPEVEAGAFRFKRDSDAISMPGWTVLGPLNVPFASARLPLELIGKHQEYYMTDEPHDSAAFLLAHTFEAEDVQEEGVPLDEIELSQGQYIVMELEKYIRCTPEIEITANHGDIIDIVYGDCLQGDIVGPFKGGARKIFTVICNEGVTNWHGVGVHGMKYMMIFCRTAAESVGLRDIGVRTLTTQVREPASFVCSDELMNQIWETSQNTLHATYDSIFLNAGGQQEFQVLSDAMVQALTSLYTFGSGDFSERALRDYAEMQYETGEMPAIAPGDYSVRLLDSMLLWPVWLSWHFRFTGDKNFVNEMIPHMESLFSFMESQAQEQGCLLGKPSSSFVNDCIIDYDNSLERRGVSTALNGFYCHSLLKAGWIYEQLGMEEKAKELGQQASKIAKAMRGLTWNKDKGLFADSWMDGAMSSSYSMQTNVMALASGIAEPDNYSKIFNNIFIDYAPFQNLEIDPKSDNPYFKFFLLDMAYSLGHREWATDFMRYYWGGMIRNGAETWWEYFSPDIDIAEVDTESYCHGYGVCTNYFIINEVLGLRPVDPGYYQVYFDPHLTAVEWATASIPTPHGHIKLDWRFQETGQLEVSIESSYPLEIVPQLDPAVASDTVLKVGENVNILGG